MTAGNKINLIKMLSQRTPREFGEVIHTTITWYADSDSIVFLSLDLPDTGYRNDKFFYQDKIIVDKNGVKKVRVVYGQNIEESYLRLTKFYDFLAACKSPLDKELRDKLANAQNDVFEIIFTD